MDVETKLWWSALVRHGCSIIRSLSGPWLAASRARSIRALHTAPISEKGNGAVGYIHLRIVNDITNI